MHRTYNSKSSHPRIGGSGNELKLGTYCSERSRLNSAISGHVKHALARAAGTFSVTRQGEAAVRVLDMSKVETTRVQLLL